MRSKRPARRVLWIAGALVAACAVAGFAAFLLAYLPAALAVSLAKAEVPGELEPVPETLARVALCIHPNGVSHIAARRLLEAARNTEGRPLTWTIRYLVWTKAVEWGTSDGGMSLFASSLMPFAKPPAQLTAAEALDLLARELRPPAPPPHLLERLRERCL